jgi:hypothetical protein
MAAVAAHDNQEEKNRDDRGSGPIFERGAGVNSPIIQPRQEKCERYANQQSRQEHGIARDPVQLPVVELGKKKRKKLADSHSFPGTHDEIRQQHDPAGDVADDWREDLRSVGGFARCIGQALDPLAVNVTDRQQQNAANGEAKHRAQRPATAQPVVHDHNPAGTDHGAEAEREIIPQTQFAGECRHLVRKGVREHIHFLRMLLAESSQVNGCPADIPER